MIIEDKWFFPATQWHDIGDGIAWRNYKHWGANVWAGEGLEIFNGDRSGCLHTVNDRKLTNRPTVVESRIYRKGDTDISAVFSYPMGIGAVNEYFWEIYDYVNDIERFTGETAEQEMERYIKEHFLHGPNDHAGDSVDERPGHGV